jgi:hypothetical protein
MPLIRYEHPAWLREWRRKSDGDLQIDLLPSNQREKMAMIAAAVDILTEYEEKGYQLTLRQLYYQFVARDLIKNDDRNYKRLGSAVSDGRMWGFIDWEHLVDRGRNFLTRTHWRDPAEIIAATAHSFSRDRWENSEYRFEVWVEKQALEDIVSRACTPLDVGYLACKGYMSQSEMWSAAQRIRAFEDTGQQVILLHLGDHDPSGIDMTRDIADRLRGFGCECDVQRIALTMEQIEQYGPPPNPAKVTDSRFEDYLSRYGSESWELDALEPEVIVELIRSHVQERVDESYTAVHREELEGRTLLQRASEQWDELRDHLDDEQ